MLKILIFGAGLARYPILRFLNPETTILMGYLDNNPIKVGRILDGVPVYKASNVNNLIFDYIIISSEGAYREISEQLLEIGVPKEKIVQPYNYMAYFPDRYFFNETEVKDSNIQLLFTSNYILHLYGWIT